MREIIGLPSDLVDPARSLGLGLNECIQSSTSSKFINYNVGWNKFSPCMMVCQQTGHIILHVIMIDTQLTINFIFMSVWLRLNLRPLSEEDEKNTQSLEH